EDRHAGIAAVEALDGTLILGSASVTDFHVRADVNSKYNLPSGTRTGFDFPAHHPHAAPREPFELLIRARLRDGSHTPTLFVRLLAAPPPERHPLHLLGASLPPNARGL